MQIQNNRAIFLVGGPGSGKDFLLRSLFSEEFTLTELSLDKLVHAVIKKISLEEVELNQPIIVNGTAEDEMNVILSKKILEAMGYETMMVYVYTSDEESKLRNDERASAGRNTISENVRHVKYGKCLKNMHTFSEEFGASFFLFDNSKDYYMVSEEEQNQIAVWMEELSDHIGVFLLGEEVFEINRVFEDTFVTDENADDKPGGDSGRSENSSEGSSDWSESSQRKAWSHGQ